MPTGSSLAWSAKSLFIKLYWQIVYLRYFSIRFVLTVCHPHYERIKVLILLLFIGTIFFSIGKCGNEAVDFLAITLLIRGHFSSASSLEIGEDVPKEEKLSCQDNYKNSNSFIPTFTSILFFIAQFLLKFFVCDNVAVM